MRLLSMYLMTPAAGKPDLTEAFFDALPNAKMSDMIHPIKTLTGSDRNRVRNILAYADYVSAGQGVYLVQYVMPKAIEPFLEKLYPVIDSHKAEHFACPMTENTLEWLHDLMLPWMSVFKAVDQCSIDPTSTAQLTWQGVQDLHRLCSCIASAYPGT